MLYRIEYLYGQNTVRKFSLYFKCFLLYDKEYLFVKQNTIVFYL